jgi:hypothetical protein
VAKPRVPALTVVVPPGLLLPERVMVPVPVLTRSMVASRAPERIVPGNRLLALPAPTVRVVLSK